MKPITKFEKMISVIDEEAVQDIKKIPETISSLNLFTQSSDKMRKSAFVLQKSNIQIPNVFLRTKNIPECEKFLKDSMLPINDIEKWNSQIDRLHNAVAEIEEEQIYEDVIAENIYKYDDDFVNNKIREYF